MTNIVRVQPDERNLKELLKPYRPVAAAMNAMKMRDLADLILAISSLWTDIMCTQKYIIASSTDRIAGAITHYYIEKQKGFTPKPGELRRDPEAGDDFVILPEQNLNEALEQLRPVITAMKAMDLEDLIDLCTAVDKMRCHLTAHTPEEVTATLAWFYITRVKEYTPKPGELRQPKSLS